MISRTDFRKADWITSGRVLDPRISGEGDLVQRRHELGRQDLGQEQGGGVDAERVRIEQRGRR